MCKKYLYLKNQKNIRWKGRERERKKQEREKEKNKKELVYVFKCVTRVMVNLLLIHVIHKIFYPKTFMVICLILIVFLVISFSLNFFFLYVYFILLCVLVRYICSSYPLLKWSTSFYSIVSDSVINMS